MKEIISKPRNLLLQTLDIIFNKLINSYKLFVNHQSYSKSNIMDAYEQ